MIKSELARRTLRLCLVLVCAAGACWAFAAGPHATSPVIVGAAQPGHDGGEDTSQALDEAASVARRRRLVAGVVRRLPARTAAGWVALVERARRRLIQRARVLDVWPDRLAACTGLLRLSIQRT